MRTWLIRVFRWTLILFLVLFAAYAAQYTYRAVAYHGDNVSFASCPSPLIYGEDDGCVTGLQRLLDAEPPHASLQRDGMFGPLTLAATRQFQASHGLQVTGKADSVTVGILEQHAPDPGSLPIAAVLLTTAIMGAVILTRKLITGAG